MDLFLQPPQALYSQSATCLDSHVAVHLARTLPTWYQTLHESRNNVCYCRSILYIFHLLMMLGLQSIPLKTSSCKVSLWLIFCPRAIFSSNQRCSWSTNHGCHQRAKLTRHNREWCPWVLPTILEKWLEAMASINTLPIWVPSIFFLSSRDGLCVRV